MYGGRLELVLLGPRPAARAFLTVIAKEPEAVKRALG